MTLNVSWSQALLARSFTWNCEQWRTGFQGLNIRCARVGGVELPKKKRIETALQYIHGVGQTTARQILLSVGLENKITAELSESELTKIRDELSNYMIEGELVGLKHPFAIIFECSIATGRFFASFVSSCAEIM